MNSKVIILFFALLHLPISVLAQWEIKYLDEKDYSYVTLKFLNDSVGFGLGGSKVLKSIDGGENWEQIETNINTSISDFHITNDSTIVGVGYTISNYKSTSTIIRSTDYGETWDSIAAFADKQLLTVSFLNSDTGLTGGFNGIYRTADGGNSWDTIWTVTDNGYRYGEIRKISFPNSISGYSIGYAVDYDYNSGNFLLKTNDSGLNWSIQNSFTNSLSSLCFLNADTGFVGTDNGFLLKTTDGGQSWIENQLVDQGFIAVFAIHFLSDSVGFAVGGNSVFFDEPTYFFVSKTIDGGDYWETYETIGLPLNSVFFINDSIGFVSGDYSLIMKSGKELNGLPENYPWHLVEGYNYDETINKKPISIFPNPASNYVRLVSPQVIEQATLVDLSGRKVKVFNPNEFVLDIPVQHLVNGFYFVKLKLKNGQTVVRFVKE